MPKDDVPVEPEVEELGYTEVDSAAEADGEDEPAVDAAEDGEEEDEEDGEGDGASDADAKAPDAKSEAAKGSDADAELGKFLRESIADNPIATILRLADHLGVRDDVAKEMSGSKSGADSPDELTDYVPQSLLEEKLMPHREWIEQGEKMVRSTLQTHAQVLDTVYAENLALRHQVSALAEVAGVKLDPLDMRAVYDWMGKNRGKSIDDAIAATYGETVKKVAKAASQKARPRPSTLGQKSAKPAPNGKARSLVEVLRAQGLDPETARLGI